MSSYHPLSLFCGGTTTHALFCAVLHCDRSNEVVGGFQVNLQDCLVCKYFRMYRVRSLGSFPNITVCASAGSTLECLCRWRPKYEPRSAHRLMLEVVLKCLPAQSQLHRKKNDEKCSNQVP